MTEFLKENSFLGLLGTATNSKLLIILVSALLISMIPSPRFSQEDSQNIEFEYPESWHPGFKHSRLLFLSGYTWSLKIAFGKRFAKEQKF